MPVFGPVPSRRLGRSLGVNNVPFKHCSYSCVYCQLGRTTSLTVTRREFYRPERIFSEVRKRVAEIGRERIDYISFVPDGEPTLDVNIGIEIEMLKPLGKVAVITNSSLLFREDVKEALLGCDLVSIKIDSVEEEEWRAINRPHGSLKLDAIMEGVAEFAFEFKGTLITETMLIDRLSTLEGVEKIAVFLESINPHKSYLAIPTRPPAENVKGVKKDFILRAKEIFDEHVNAEVLVDVERGQFEIRTAEDLLSLVSVHPIREKTLKEYLKKLDVKIEDIIDDLEVVEFEGVKFYRRKNL